MNIGFDAKRVFFNRSGLGNYSRSTVSLMQTYCPGNHYTLFSPKKDNRTGFTVPEGMQVAYPGPVGKLMPSLWRSAGMSCSIRSCHIDIYHGLSNELPSDIRRSGARSVVTIHDLIFVRLPELYKPLDRAIYIKKYRHSCDLADKIMAISIQTRDDLVNFWHIDPARIEIIYQGCDPAFYDPVSETTKQTVREKYALPRQFVLSVGTIEERKNLMLTLRAMASDRTLDFELVALGRRTPYADRLMEFARREGFEDRIHMIHNACFADFPAIYQSASALVYTSRFEGFGIPILEGLNSRIPVITTRGGVFSETGGEACLYTDPDDAQEIAACLGRALGDQVLRHDLAARGIAHAEKFREPEIAKKIERLYKSII